jgi:membrane protein YqaA with SNARE-associated domain
MQRAMLKSAYDWCIGVAHKPYALWLMGLMSFLDSSVFPVRPDAMLIPMALARPEKAWTYAALRHLGRRRRARFIGAFLYDSVGQWLISL